jgi:hypothetical protein
MGRFNELLGAASQYSKGLAALFNVQEQEGVPTLAPELVAMVDIFSRPELWALHAGTLLWGSAVVVAGGAGNRSQAAIEPGTDELVIVERIAVGAPASVSISLRLSTVPLTTSTGNLVARDARRIITAGGSGASGTRIMTQNNAPLSGSATQTAFIQVPAATTVHIPLDMVLVTPWSLRIVAAADNVNLDAFTIWVRTRMATPRELAIGSL